MAHEDFVPPSLGQLNLSRCWFIKFACLYVDFVPVYRIGVFWCPAETASCQNAVNMFLLFFSLWFLPHCWSCSSDHLVVFVQMDSTESEDDSSVTCSVTCPHEVPHASPGIIQIIQTHYQKHPLCLLSTQAIAFLVTESFSCLIRLFRDLFWVCFWHCGECKMNSLVIYKQWGSKNRYLTHKVG